MLKKLLTSIALVIPILIIFRNLFFGNLATWGDAPHFYREEIKELISEPPAWNHRAGSFGGVNTFIFIWPVMFLYGLIGNNDLAIRILFYFTSIILSGLGSYFLVRYLKLSKIVQFFSVLIYLLNTYYMLLIDGGQVGVALAYGFFPLTLLFLKKFLDTPMIKSFVFSLLFLVLLSIADPRIAAISILTIFLWQILEKKFRSLIYLVPLIVSWLGVGMYWLMPFIGSMATGQNSMGTVIKWYNPMFLFSPHWPENLFGKITSPPIYFALIPLLIFASRSYMFIVLFSIFAFSSLGLIPFDKIPFGFAFRDSTKFFIPLVLFAGILIGKTLEKKSFILQLITYIYLLFLIAPAIMGRMNFVLSGRQEPKDFEKIYQNLKSETGFFRTVWFPEKRPLAFMIEEKPAVDARDLARFWPFANINASEDPYNFLNDENFVEWFRILGVKYLILSDNPREITKSIENKKNWETILGLIDSNKNLSRVDWGTKIPIYKVENTYPRFYMADKMFAAVGSQLDTNRHPLTPVIYFEDGKWDPRVLSEKDSNSVEILLNGSEKIDLAMSFLQKHFLSSKEAEKNEWANYSPAEYLKYKYELLIRGVKFNDFDYQKGIAFSSIKGEKMKFVFKVPFDGEYVLALRKTNFEDQNLSWSREIKSLAKGNFEYEVVNDSGFEILNTIALVPKKEFEEALALSESYISSFGVIEENLEEIEIERLEVKKLRTLRYGFENQRKNFWVIFNEGFNSGWKLKRGKDYFESVPVFSMVNAFYVKNDWRDLSIDFVGQEKVRFGIYWSIVSVMVLAIICLMKSKV